MRGDGRDRCSEKAEQVRGGRVPYLGDSEGGLGLAGSQGDTLIGREAAIMLGREVTGSHGLQEGREAFYHGSR